MKSNWKSCLFAAAALIAVATIHAQSSGTYTVQNLTVNGTATGAFGATSGTFQATVTDLKATRSTHTATNDLLTIAAGRCWGTTKSATTIRITAGSGNGSYVAYCTDSQSIVVEHSTSAGLTVTVSGLVPLQVTTPAIPEGMVPIATGTITSGAWDAPTDARDWAIGGQIHNNGTGMNVACSGGVCVHAIDTAVVPQLAGTNEFTGRLSGTAAASTAPNKVGTSAPGSCSTGDTFFDSDATAGQNVLVCVSNTWYPIGGSSTATHTYMSMVRCNSLDGVHMSDFWQQPKNGIGIPSTSCGDGTQFGRGNLGWAHNSTQYMFLVYPIPANRTGAVDFDIYGFDLGGSGSFTFDIAKMCSTDSTAWDAAESWTDTESITWTSTNTNVVRRGITGITLPSSCSSGNWLVVRLTRNNTSTAATTYYMRAARAIMRTN